MSPEGKPINQESTSIQRTYRIHAKEGIMHNTTVNNRLSARRGVEWYKEAYELFKKAPFALIALSIANILASLVFSQIPVLGYFLQIASGMVFSFGSCLVIDQLYRAGTFQWHLLLAPIKSRPMEILGFWIFSKSGILVLSKSGDFGYVKISGFWIIKIPGFTKSKIQTTVIYKF